MPEKFRTIDRVKMQRTMRRGEELGLFDASRGRNIATDRALLYEYPASFLRGYRQGQQLYQHADTEDGPHAVCSLR